MIELTLEEGGLRLEVKFFPPVGRQVPLAKP